MISFLTMPELRRLLTVFVILLSNTGIVRADVPVLSARSLDAFVIEGAKSTTIGKLERVAVQGQPFDRALRLSTTSDATLEWDVQTSLVTNFPVAKGDVLLARFWLRCVGSVTGQGRTGLVFEQNGSPYDKAVDVQFGASATWTECVMPFRADRDFPAGQAHLVFRGGFERQTIEIGGIELQNYGQNVDINTLPHTKRTYAGREADAPWRKAALERIEKIRKGDFEIQIVDAGGKNVTGAAVHVELKRHAFGFGSCVTVAQLTGTSPDDVKCREIIDQYFSRVVFENDMKWPAVWDGVPPALDRAVAWLRDRQIAIRGHNLIWPSWQWLPSGLRAYANDPAELRQRVATHVADVVSHFRGKLIEWDVVNEPYTNADLQKILGDDVMADWFKLAHAADPACRLVVNDFGIFDTPASNEHHQHFFNTIHTLQAEGAPIGGIGIQSHFSGLLPPPAQLLSTLDEFATLGLPIESTEVSITDDDPQLQADYLRDYMIAVFSHPKVEAIILWGFWESAHWRPKAALWNRDWSPRPIATAWVDLVGQQWHTDETLTSDASGVVRLRGFFGIYTITVSANGKSTTAVAMLDSKTSKVQVTTK